MSRKYFGTDGIRGRANGLITPELALKVGQAAGLVFQRGEHRHRRRAVALIHHTGALRGRRAGVWEGDLARGQSIDVILSGERCKRRGGRPGAVYADAVLGQIPANGRREAEVLRMLAQTPDKRRDRVGDLVVARPAGEREPAGDGQLTCVREGVDPLRGHVHGKGPEHARSLQRFVELPRRGLQPRLMAVSARCRSAQQATSGSAPACRARA